MLNEFVEKILVHEADYSSGERVQEVEIYLNFIGKFELPVKEPTAEEIAEHEKLKARRAKKAEYNADTWKSGESVSQGKNRNQRKSQ